MQVSSVQGLARLATSGALVATIALGAVAGPTLAKGSGGKTGGGSSSLAVKMVVDNNHDGLPNFNDTITFTVTTTQTTQPYVSLTCSQNGVLVYSANAGFYASYPWPGAQNMPLYSPSWTGGAADCVATLNTSLATLKFHVNA